MRTNTRTHKKRKIHERRSVSNFNTKKKKKKTCTSGFKIIHKHLLKEMEASYGQPPYCTTGVENFSSSKDKKNNSPNQSLALRSNLPCLALSCLDSRREYFESLPAREFYDAYSQLSAACKVRK